MKVRVILERRSWEYRLHVIQQEPGRYYVELRQLDGAKIKPPAIAGTYPSLDLIIDQAETIYLTLVAMRESNAAAGAANTTTPEISPAHVH